MRIIFMGTPDFAVPSLHILLKHSYNVISVVTSPDKPRGRGQQISFTPIKQFALKNNLPVLQPETLNDKVFIEQIKSLNPDLIIVVAFKILPKEIFSIPKYGAFNLHASLLPKYRGAAPINWAIINGDKETGVTTFFLQEKVDTGAIILQSKINIEYSDNAGILHDKLMNLGSTLVLDTVKLIESGNVTPYNQDNLVASNAPKIFKQHCKIDWNLNSINIYNIVRGLSPYPAAWTTHNNKIIKIYKTEIINSNIEKNINSGTIIEKTSDKLFVKTNDGIISILEIQQEGKRILSISEFLRGYNISKADSFI